MVTAHMLYNMKTTMRWRHTSNLSTKQYKEPVEGKFEDVTDIIVGINDSSDEESSEEEAQAEVKEITDSGEEEDRIE